MSWPHTFAGLSGNVPAGYLDDNFNAALQASMAAGTIYGNNTGGMNPATQLTAAQVYAMLKGVIPWEVVGFIGGSPSASWQVLRYQSSTPVIISTAACISSSGIAATASTTFTIADNGASFGSIVFSASGSVGSVSITGSPYTLVSGHVLTVTAPVSPDVTLANINFTLGGVRG